MIARLRGLGAAVGGWRLRLAMEAVGLLVAGAAVGGSGGSELTKNGSHLVAAVFSDKPRRSYDGGPQRAVQNQASCCTGRPRRTVRYRKRPRSVREANLSAGAARGGGSKHRCDGKLGNRWLATGGWWQRRLGDWRPHDGEGAHGSEDANMTARAQYDCDTQRTHSERWQIST